MNARQLALIDALAEEGIAKKQMPGCVVCIGRREGIVFLKAYGNRRLLPEPEPMTDATVFDMASITKPVATATSIMILVERGKLRVADKVSAHIPPFGANGKRDITVLQLLTHQGSLIPDNPLADYADSPEKSFERIYALKTVSPPGSTFRYSDVGFLVLGELVRTLSGDDVAAFSKKNVFEPLGMSQTAYLPSEDLRKLAAPTEKRGENWIQGEVHDPRAHRLGGVAGHAGLFSTARDLAVYASMMLGEGTFRGVRILGPQSARLMTAPQPVSTGFRTLGFDMRTGYSINRGENLSDAAFGHGGFTGTVFWIDPELDLFVIFLSNRVHMPQPTAVNMLAGRIGTVAAAAIEKSPDRPKGMMTFRSRAAASDSALPAARPRRQRDRSSEALNGIDVLVRDHFKPLEGQRVGLITNHTGQARDGQRTVDLLHKAGNLKLVALFSPEHGFEGKLDVSKIDDARDEATGLPVHSLYGATRTPTDESLQGIDTLVFDIIDIGCRYYTYPATMGNAMKAAVKHGKRFVVLDRPNPIGAAVAGPILDPGSESFVAYHTIPIRHGLTVGELALLFNREQNIGCKLDVIKVEGWDRSDYFDSIGQTWVNPSPNMRSLTQALLYPGIGMFETTNVSVGRGTDTPFEVMGAPWLDGQMLARELNQSGLEGVRFVPIRFTPTSSTHRGRNCSGINIIVTDRTTFEPVQTGIEIAVRLRSIHSKDWEMKNFNRLLGHKETFAAIESGRPAAEIVQTFAEPRADFMRRRDAILLYP